MDDGATIIQQGWLELSSLSAKKGSKGWLNRAVSKSWKRFFFILHKNGTDNDHIVLCVFEKEENIRYTVPKKEMVLSPRYKVHKKSDFKSKEFVIEVGTETETWFLAAESQKELDLWVIQIQMQTRLSRSISGRIFSVTGTSIKALQRIGGKDQQCLLHFTKWGITLALQQSRSILALWPLSTIRNYECTGTGQFCFESGRRSPMGTGKYVFFTGKGEDEVMFNVIDVFVNARLNADAEIRKSSAQKETTDEELLETYDKLHSCALGLMPHTEAKHSEEDVTPATGTLGRSEPRFVQMDYPPPYSRLEHNTSKADEIDAASPMPLPTPDFTTLMGPDRADGVDRSASFNSPQKGMAYDQLDRTQSWGSKSHASMYDHIERSTARVADSYDHIDRVPGHGASFSIADHQQKSPSTAPVSAAATVGRRSPMNCYEDHPCASTNAALVASGDHATNVHKSYPNAIYAQNLAGPAVALKSKVASAASGITAATVSNHGNCMQQKSPAVAAERLVMPLAGKDTKGENTLGINDLNGMTAESALRKSYENIKDAVTQDDPSDDVIGLIDNMIAETNIK